jgi:hypothetical protein
MNTDITLFENKGLPAHLVDLNAQTNIIPRESIPMLSFRGKVFRNVVGGEESIVYKMGKDANGNIVQTDEPATMVAVIVLDYNKNRSRAYFEGAYEEGKATPPTCWSHDGIVPHESVQNKQAATCASCPQSVKGSKVSDAGKELTACAQFKRVAVLPATNTKHPSLLLKLPQTSMWDKDAEEFAQKGWYAFDQYLDMLKRRGVNHTASVITKIRFDPRPPYPKLLFGPLDWTPADIYDDVQEHLADQDTLNKIMSADPAGGEVDLETAAAAEAAATVAAAAKPTPAPAPAKPAAAAKPAARPAPPKPAPAPAPAPAPVAAPPEDEDELLMGTAVAAAPAAAPAPAKPAAKPAVRAAAKPAAVPAEPVTVSGDDGITDLLSSWEQSQ